MLSRAKCVGIGGALLLAIAAQGPGEAGAGVPGEFLGIAGEDISIGDADYRAEAQRDQAGAGAGLVRLTFDWSRIELEPGVYDLSAYDREVAAAAEAGLRVLPVLATPPDFRQLRPEKGARRGSYPPRPAEMADFAAMLARRYGPGGSLFAERPELPALPIRSWQVWNEPNLTVYWQPRPNARAYIRLLRAVGRAIEGVDPRAEIVSAGLPQSRQGVPFERFVNAMYRAGGRGTFDALAVHPYARSERGVIGAVELARRLTRRHRDGRRPIWVTEVGWASDGPRSPFRAGTKGQATRIRRTLLGLAKRRKRLRVRGVVYYNWRDHPHLVPRSRDFFGLHTGLLWPNGQRKPGYYAFRRAARALR
jgi:hypothetical protein